MRTYDAAAASAAQAQSHAAALTAALEAATALGLPVFPCRANKAPACPHGFKSATRVPHEIIALWRRHPGPLVGVPTGTASGVDALDVDIRGGGDRWLAAHRDRLPVTRVHRTRSGGWHILFQCDPRLRNSAGRIAPGVDVRGGGGYICWWPAAGLAVDHPDALAPWPPWLLEILLPPPRPRGSAPTPVAVPDRYARGALKSACERIRSAPVGQRNATLNAEAYALARLIGPALSARELAAALAAAAVFAGLPPREVAATLASALGARGVA